MQLLMSVPVLLILILGWLLPFSGDRAFSMKVQRDWLVGREGRRTRLLYQAAILFVAAGCGVIGALFWTRPMLLAALPLVAAAGVLAAWSWGWRRTLPFRMPESVSRTALLRPNGAWGWPLAALLPICVDVVLLVRKYRTLPASLPVHFRITGAVDRVAAKDWHSAFGVLIVGTICVVMMAGLLWLLEHRSAGVADGGRYAFLTRCVVIAGAWMVALQCSAIGLLPVLPDQRSVVFGLAKWSSVATFVFLVVVVAAVFRERSLLVSGQRATGVSHWRAGILYFNRDDAAIFVPKRFGFGWTLNMARPEAWLLLVLVLVVALLPLLARR